MPLLRKIIFLCFFSSPLCAQSLLTFSEGILKPHDPRPYFNFEYKWQFVRCPRFRPQLGLMTENAESLYVYTGMAFDFYWFGRLVFTPSFAPGLYFANGGVNLWFPIEFRSAIEIAYELPVGARAGLLLFHLSNAHLSEKNPGVNGTGFFISIPF